MLKMAYGLDGGLVLMVSSPISDLVSKYFIAALIDAQEDLQLISRKYCFAFFVLLSSPLRLKILTEHPPPQ